ncbi:MAG: DUF3298 and DUF4163 domain-containing protein [Paramuribaculum sp.]|nr:DUF3298 and DUF4163 domain-containing protein [Paramuribaculum sp.]
MRHTLFTLVSGLTTALVISIGSCSQPSTPASAGITTVVSGSSSDGETIDTIRLSSTLINCSRSFAFTLDGEQCYYTISTLADWPTQIGSTNIKELQDTLIAAAMPSQRGLDIETAMTGFLNDTAGIVSGPATIITPSSVPDTTSNAWSLDMQIDRTGLNDRYVSYRITATSYLGGAHPNTVETPISFDLDEGHTVTMSTLFVNGSSDALLKIISANLARQLGCPDGEFKKGNLFNDTLTSLPSGMSINRNGEIVFTYQQYEIAPYSEGIIRIKVSPMQVEKLLTPRGRALLGL